MTLVSSLLLSSLSLNTVLGVITNQGPRWPVEDDEDVEDNEVREFTGWIQGRPEDYIMNLQRQQHRSKAQSNTRKTAVGPKLNLFSPGIKNDYEYLIKKQNEVANFTYKMGPYNGMPKKVVGMYILLADDTEPGFASDNYDWEPRLHPYQQIGSNVLFFTFINPATMEVPVAFKKLAATRCKDTVGAIPCDTRVISQSEDTLTA